MKFLGLVEQDLDVVSKEYVDKKIASIPTGSGEESAAVKNKAKINIMAIYMGLPLIAKYSDNVPLDAKYEDLVYEFIKYGQDKEGVNMQDKYNTNNYPNSYVMLRDILKKDPFVYFEEEILNEMMHPTTQVFKLMKANIVLTQTEYDRLSEKNPNAIYFIKED